ncbi:lanthionine synthetase LanC family protein [Spirosoma radiotolerans]|uniref:Lanthionine synthetase n=1 Tax=Spirosoma radiotolerans TaxID=1379870 RepID=A0A0E3ZWN6_9BACT|nr:lanthionine synthetase LanC family protein [Spirosoma radiotolerans]AKD55845.1 hypothetical protein SD10_13990 [Spirosoma radiotolerans]
MNALILPANAATLQTIERQVNRFVHKAFEEQRMTRADQWLYSVWNGSANWTLLEGILADNAQSAVSLPVLIGCLQAYRQQPTKRQTVLLEHMDKLAYEQATSRLSQGQVGILSGGAASLHYLLLASMYSEKPRQYSDELVRLASHTPMNYASSMVDLSMGNGQTGLMLTLIEGAERTASEKRIAHGVSELGAIIDHYLRYLLEHQIPVDSQTDTWFLFPTSVCGDEWNITERLTWEVGDVGQLLLLYRAHQLLEQPNVARWADRLSGFVLQRRAMNRVRLDPPGLIDGKAGLSLLFRRLHLITGEADFQHEGEYWLGQLLADVQAGYQPTDWSLLTGTLGISGAIRQWLGHDLSLDLLFL